MGLGARRGTIAGYSCTEMALPWDRTVKGTAKPSKLVYDFCKTAGICTRCRTRWAQKADNMCLGCADRHSLKKKIIRQKRINAELKGEGNGGT